MLTCRTNGEFTTFRTAFQPREYQTEYQTEHQGTTGHTAGSTKRGRRAPHTHARGVFLGKFWKHTSVLPLFVKACRNKSTNCKWTVDTQTPTSHFPLTSLLLAKLKGPLSLFWAPTQACPSLLPSRTLSRVTRLSSRPRPACVRQPVIPSHRQKHLPRVQLWPAPSQKPPRSPRPTQSRTLQHRALRVLPAPAQGSLFCCENSQPPSVCPFLHRNKSQSLEQPTTHTSLLEFYPRLKAQRQRHLRQEVCPASCLLSQSTLRISPSPRPSTTLCLAKATVRLALLSPRARD